MAYTTAFVLLACALAVSADIDLSNKKTVFADGVDKHVNIEALAKKLPAYTLMKDARTNERCWTGAASCGAMANAQSSFTQTFEDGLAVAICLCDGHVMGAAEVAKKFAHVPAGLRSSVNLLAAKPAGDGAYSINNAIAFLGTYSANVFVVEAAHNFDTANGVSDSKAFIDALNKDSCVVDDHSQLSTDEAWASSVLLWSSFLLTNASKFNDKQFQCMMNQRMVVQSHLPVETTPAAFFSQVYDVIPMTNKNSQLGVSKDNMTITTAGATARKWQFLRASGRSFMICDTTAHLCIDAYGRRGNGEAPILFTRRNGGINQRWNLVAAGNTHTFQNQANGLFLDIASCSKFSNSSNAVMAVQSNSNCQKWILREQPKPKPPTSTFTKTHSSSFTETTRPTQSFSAQDQTKTKTNTATISTKQIDVVSSTSSFKDSAPQRITSSVSFRDSNGKSATRMVSRSVIETGSRTRPVTATALTNKTRTATQSVRASTFTAPTRSHSESRTFGSSHIVSKTRSEAPSTTSSKPTAKYTFTYSDVNRPTQTYTAQETSKKATHSESRTATSPQTVSTSRSYVPPSRTIRRTESVSVKQGDSTIKNIITKSAIDFNATLPHTRAFTATIPSNRTRTVSEAKMDSTVTGTTPTRSHTATRTFGSSHTVSKTKSDGPTRTATMTRTVSRTVAPSGSQTKPRVVTDSQTATGTTK